MHLDYFPGSEDTLGSKVNPKQMEAVRADWQTLMAVRDEVLKALETARQDKLIGSSLEAQVTLTVPEAIFPVLERRQADLRAIFITSAVQLHKDTAGNGASAVRVEVSKAPGRKCERCWNYSTHVGENSIYPTVCERCSAALKELENGNH